MKKYVFTGRSEEEALQSAFDELNVTNDDAFIWTSIPYDESWEITVAKAAPRAPQRKPITNSRSRIRLSTAAILMKIKGRLESPMPRSIAEPIL